MLIAAGSRVTKPPPESATRAPGRAADMVDVDEMDAVEDRTGGRGVAGADLNPDVDGLDQDPARVPAVARPPVRAAGRHAVDRGRAPRDREERRADRLLDDGQLFRQRLGREALRLGAPAAYHARLRRHPAAEVVRLPARRHGQLDAERALQPPAGR